MKARTWLVLALVAALVVVAGAGAAPERHQQQQKAELGPAATFILKGLATGALEKIGGSSVGWVMDSIGLGDPTSAQLAEIKAELQRLNAELQKVQAQLSQVRSDVLQGNCNVASHQAAGILSKVSLAQAELDDLPNVPKADRAKQTESLKTYIHDHLLAEQDHLDRIVGVPGPGAEGLIVTCGKAIEASDSHFITFQTGVWVHEIANYYIAWEIALLNLRVEYMHMTKKSGSFIKADIEKVSTAIANQEKLVKPTLAANDQLFVDKRHNLMWKVILVPFKQSELERDIQRENDQFDFGAWGNFRVTTADQLSSLFQGWNGASAVDWLQNKVGLLHFKNQGPQYWSTCIWTANTLGIMNVRVAYDLNSGGPTFIPRGWPDAACFAWFARPDNDWKMYSYTG